ncbi:MAG: hypothetical protein Q9218_004891 [Villophora microphyllina]
MKPEKSTSYGGPRRRGRRVLLKHLSYAIVGCLSALVSFLIMIHFHSLEGHKLQPQSPIPESVYGLEPGLETKVENAGVYTLSGAHQSHCLQKLIREALMTVMSGNTSVLVDGAGVTDNEIHQSKALSHAFHCVDYLRQVIMCNADTTVEWEAIDAGESGHSGHINGYGVPHQCRNWASQRLSEMTIDLADIALLQDELRSWMEQRYPPDEKFKTQ